MPKGMGYGGSGGSRSAKYNMGMGEGMTGSPKRQNSRQPSGSGMAPDMPGAFGKGSGSKSVAGVTYEGAASKDAASNRGGNYNVVEGKARVFGNGGAMRGR